jgi:hypothetical protein
MTLRLVLEDFSIPGVQLAAGTVVEDTAYDDFQRLRDAGLADIAFDAVFQPVINTFLTRRAGTSLLAMLIADPTTAPIVLTADLNYGEAADVAVVARAPDAGVLVEVARADHVHDGAALPSVVVVTFAMSPFTVLVTHDVLLVDTTAGAVLLNLPAPGGVGRAGPLVVDRVNNFGVNPCTLVRFAAELIDNVAANKTLAVSGYRGAVITDGTNWFTP